MISIVKILLTKITLALLTSAIPIFSSALFNVNILFQHLSHKDGLPSTPYYMCQDHLGYIWFGCAHGVFRFDGYEFKLYEPQPDTSPVRTKMNIGIYADLEGNIWIAEQENDISINSAIDYSA